MTPQERQQRYDAVSGATETPLDALAILFVPLIILPEVVSLPAAVTSAFAVAGWVVWAIFAAELALMTYLAPDRNKLFADRWWEFGIVAITVPIPTLEKFAVLRPLRLLRSARFIRALRAARFVGFLGRVVPVTRGVLLRHGLQYVLLSVITIYAGAAGIVWALEADTRSGIDSYPDALWWGISIMTNLPNEGNVPVTPAGKAMAVFVAFLGLSVAGLVTANVAAFLVHADEAKEARLTDIQSQLERIEQRLEGVVSPAPEERS